MRSADYAKEGQPAEASKSSRPRGAKEELPGSSPVPLRKEAHEVSQWGDPLRSFLEQQRSPEEVMVWLRELQPELDSPLSGYCEVIREMEDDQPTTGAPEATEPLNLLPVCISAVEERMRGKEAQASSRLVSMVEVLNYLAVMGKPRMGPPKMTAAQELMVDRLFRAVERFISKGGHVGPFEQACEALGSVKFDYSGEPINYMEDLVAEKVIPCWPQPGEAAVQDAVKFVPPVVREWLSSPSMCLLPEAAWPDSPPRSRVRASDEEWEKIVTAAVARGMMRQVPDEDVFRDARGNMVLNGAGGVKKVKAVGGVSKTLQRFISILVPSNTYQRHMPGDDVHLPYLGQMSMMEIDEDEEVLIDSEDLTSCFNLFRLPKAWSGMSVFAKRVSARVFGGPATEMTYVGMAVVPMGWINSVALMQTVVRSLVFGLSKVPSDSEVSKLKWFPEDDSVSVVYLDSFDELRRVSKGYREILSGKPSERHRQFVHTCDHLELPLNKGKQLVGAVHGVLQGGDFDGIEGIFEASHDKKIGIFDLGIGLLGAGEATEFELRHFAGKALFAMAFRRPTMAILEAIFVDMGKAQGVPKVKLSRRTMDEIYMVLTLLPVVSMNLRAQYDREVCITDASTTGGGGAIATSFKFDPATVRHDGERCLNCDRELENDRVLLCPTGCQAMLCSLRCIEQHRHDHCKRKEYVMPKFGERFSGPHAPLSYAVAEVGGIEVQEPFDYLRGDDFFSDAGKAKLERLESDPALVCEHWAPECKLFSRARGRPVQLPDGRTVAGPQALRDHHHVMGFPWASAQDKIKLRKSNNMALRGLKRGKGEFGRTRYLTLEHPYNSWLWYFSLIEELENAGFTFASGSNCCWGGDREKWYAVLNNCPGIQEKIHRPSCPGHPNLLGYGATVRPDGSLLFATEEEAEYKRDWCRAYAQGLKNELEAQGWIKEAIKDGRCAWLQSELQKSTERLAVPATCETVASIIWDMEQNMYQGTEAMHLREMARRMGIRGNDLRLHLAQDDLEVPYPAYRWHWKEVLSYAWREERPINEAEVGAFNVMLRRRAKDPKYHEMRYLGIVDSFVTRGAVTKGRSGSKALNRLLKQSAAIQLGSDQYPQLGWTISRWNFADGASRRYRPHA